MNMAEPSTPLEQDAVRHHELFLAYVAAGFTEEQALRILIGFVQQIVRGSAE